MSPFLYFTLSLITKVIFTISLAVENFDQHMLIYENSESKVFKNIKFVDEISDNWQNDLFGINVDKALEFWW